MVTFLWRSAKQTGNCFHGIWKHECSESQNLGTARANPQYSTDPGQSRKQSKLSPQNSLTYTDFYHWLLNHRVPRSCIHRFTKLLTVIRGRVLDQVKEVWPESSNKQTTKGNKLKRNLSFNFTYLRQFAKANFSEWNWL